MELESTAGTCPLPQISLIRSAGRLLLAIAVPFIASALALAAWIIRRDSPYAPSSDFGYWLGVAGGLLMLALLIYPLRKRFRSLSVIGPLKYWFRFHLVAGITGPLLVLFHSAFRIGSFNAAVALGSMLLVVFSGLVGRVLYRKVHQGLHGSRATAGEMQEAMEQQLTALEETLAGMPAVRIEIHRFSELIRTKPQNRREKILHFLCLGWKRQAFHHRVRIALAGCERKVGDGDTARQVKLQTLVQAIDSALRAIQRTAQFSTYEKLFSLWHVVHIPFLFMLLITALIHVVAVHAY